MLFYFKVVFKKWVIKCDIMLFVEKMCLFDSFYICNSLNVDYWYKKFNLNFCKFMVDF